MEAFVNAVPNFATKKVNIITDQEFKFSNIFPVGNHLFCWNHILNDLRWHARNKCNCTIEEVNVYFNIFRRMIDTTTEADFDEQWDKAKDKFKTKSKILEYFEKHLIPKFKCVKCDVYNR